MTADRVADTVAGRVPADLATLAARFGAALHAEGVPVGPDRCARFARAVTLLAPATVRALHSCGLVTLIADPAHVDAYDRVFQAVFGGLTDPADWRGHAPSPASSPVDHEVAGGNARRVGEQPHDQRGWAEAGRVDRADRAGRAGRGPDREVAVPVLAAAQERLSTRDFGELTPAELALLADVMRRLVLATPPRRSRRHRAAPRGRRPDLRAALRQARRTGGFPVRLPGRRPRDKPRRLVVLCDISGSMEPYARAMLQLLYCAAAVPAAEVFTFATRLTRLTRVLRRSRPAAALDQAGRVAPDWSGGTRIGEALKEFNDRYGLRGMARGAVVLVVSDGWETGDPALLGREMARLSRVAYRIVWANPRTASPRYRPKVAGMAAAWPYCDAVVSAHSLAALDDLLAALAAPAGRRRPARDTGER